MQDASVAVSVIIPCREERDHIESCLRSILAQVPPPGGFEVIVADGMSGDGTREILRRLAEEDPRVRVIDNPGRIVSTGLNAAIREAQGRIIVRMDVHTEYAADYLCQCLAVLQETGADNVGGPWVAKAEGLVGRAIAKAFQSPFAVGDPHGHNAGYEGPLNTVYLGCWPREVFDKVGLFDEELVRNQDDEFNLRLLRAGGRIWQSPRIRSWYRPRESLRALFRQYMQYGYWKVRVIQKHRMPTSVRHLIPASFVLSLTALPLASLAWPVAGWGGLGLLSMYAVCNLTASFRIAARHEWQLLPILPLVFACYHVAYGYGFLRGLWDFVIWRREAHRTYTELTRRSAPQLPQNTITEARGWSGVCGAEGKGGSSGVGRHRRGR
jgi:glycosyltransferase involved in cell wall biosynthesis